MFDVLVHATPLGMRPRVDQCFFEDRIPAQLVLDMVYNPLDTPLLRLAHKRGLTIISGMEMFVQQGARQFEIWTGKPAPEAEMMRVVELALKRKA